MIIILRKVLFCEINNFDKLVFMISPKDVIKIDNIYEKLNVENDPFITRGNMEQSDEYNDTYDNIYPKIKVCFKNKYALYDYIGRYVDIKCAIIKKKVKPIDNTYSSDKIDIAYLQLKSIKYHK